MTRVTWDQPSLEALGRRDLQRVAKDLGVRANNKSADIIFAILTKLGGSVPQLADGVLDVVDAEAMGRQPRSPLVSSPCLSEGGKSRPHGIIETPGFCPLKLMDADIASPKPPQPQLSPATGGRPPRAAPCDSDSNPVQSVTIPGIDYCHPGAKSELESDAETPVKANAAPEEAFPRTGRAAAAALEPMGHPAMPSPSPNPTPKPVSRALDKLKQRLRVKTPEEVPDRERPDAAAAAAAQGRTALLRRSLLDRAVSWASPKGRRARTDEWLHGSASRAPVNEAEGAAQPEQPTRRATADGAPSRGQIPADGGPTPEPAARLRSRTPHHDLPLMSQPRAGKDRKEAAGARAALPPAAPAAVPGVERRKKDKKAAAAAAAEVEELHEEAAAAAAAGEGAAPAAHSRAAGGASRAAAGAAEQQQLRAQMEELSAMQAELRRSCDDGVGRAILRRARLGLGPGEDPGAEEAGLILSRTMGRTTSAPRDAPFKAPVPSGSSIPAMASSKPPGSSTKPSRTPGKTMRTPAKRPQGGAGAGGPKAATPGRSGTPSFTRTLKRPGQKTPAPLHRRQPPSSSSSSAAGGAAAAGGEATTPGKMLTKGSGTGGGSSSTSSRPPAAAASSIRGLSTPQRPSSGAAPRTRPAAATPGAAAPPRRPPSTPASAARAWKQAPSQIPKTSSVAASKKDGAKATPSGSKQRPPQRPQSTPKPISSSSSSSTRPPSSAAKTSSRLVKPSPGGSKTQGRVSSAPSSAAASRPFGCVASKTPVAARPRTASSSSGRPLPPPGSSSKVRQPQDSSRTPARPKQQQQQQQAFAAAPLPPRPSSPSSCPSAAAAAADLELQHLFPVSSHRDRDDDFAGAALRLPGLSWSDAPDLEPARKRLQPAVDALDKGPGEFPQAAALLLMHEGSGRLAEALATELEAPLLEVGPGLLAQAQAKGRERELQDGVFTKAAELPRAVVLLDYLDLQPRGKAGRDARMQLMADLCLYLEMCAMQPRQSAVILVATSRPEMLSADLLGQLRLRVHVGLPEAAVREQMIMVELMRCADEVALDADDVDALARLCGGFSASDIAAACSAVLSSPGRAARGGGPARLGDFKAELGRREPSVAAGKAERLESWAMSHAVGPEP